MQVNLVKNIKLLEDAKYFQHNIKSTFENKFPLKSSGVFDKHGPSIYEVLCVKMSKAVEIVTVLGFSVGKILFWLGINSSLKLK